MSDTGPDIRSDDGKQPPWGMQLLQRGWRNVREAGTIQILATIVLVAFAIFIARFSWVLPDGEEPTPLTNAAERAVYDLRSYFAADLVEQDDRVIMVVFTDQTLMAARKRSPLPRDMLAEALLNLDQMNPKAIGIDILFDQPQDEDDDLIEVLRGMQTPTAVGYAEVATNEDNIFWEQEQYLREFLGALDGTNARPASVRLDNTFGATRVWPSIEANLPPVLARAMLEDAGGPFEPFADYTGAIEYRRSLYEEQQNEGAEEGTDENDSVPLFQSLDISAFVDLDPEVIPFFAEAIAGKYVLIGGEIVDYDRVETSFTSITGKEPPGISVHAEMISQMLDGRVMPQISSGILWLMAVIVVLTAVLTALLEWPARRLVPLLLVMGVLFVGLPVLLQVRDVDTYGLPAVGWLVGWIVAFTAVTAAARSVGRKQRNFATGALGKYIPRDIAQQIIDKPELLSLGGEKRAIYVMFSDLEGFTKMSHAIEPEMVAKLLNRYLEMLSNVVLEHGGVIDKFVGDAVVAFWGAPIARADDAERAAKAGYAIWEAGEAFRKEVAAMDPNLPKIGKTRVGLHYGEAVIGNFGGETRIQYTALGDSMNTAARLEAANKALQSSVMASREFAERSGLDWWRAMGRVRLRGRAQPVDIFEPAPGFPVEDREKLAESSNLAETDPAKATQLVAEVVAGHPADLALLNLINRLDNLDEGGTYVLG